MFLDDFHMISFDENKELYRYQRQLVTNYIDTNDENIILQIAILLTLPPVADYLEAIKLLKRVSLSTNNISAFILGAYFMSEYISDEENYFITILVDSLESIKNNKDKSIAYYLIGKDLKKKNRGEESLIWFEKSIEYGPEYVNNYLELSELSSYKDKQQLIDTAKANVRCVLSEKAASEMTVEEICSFDNFVDEFILGIKLTEPVYESYFCSAGEGDCECV